MKVNFEVLAAKRRCYPLWDDKELPDHHVICDASKDTVQFFESS